MKNSWIRIAFLVFLAAVTGAAHGAEPDRSVNWQEISVSLEPERHMVLGESTVAYAPGTRRARLRLNQGARVKWVRVGGQDVSYTFTAGVLSLELPQQGTAPVVSISYRAGFNDPVSGHPAAGEDPSYGVNAAVTKEGTFLGGGAYWYPVPERMPATRKTLIAAPAGIEGVTSGARVSRETADGVTRSVWREARPVGVLSLSAGPYLVEERETAGIKLYSYLYADNAQLAPRYLDAAGRYLALYQELFGPYPFEKFAVVENFFPTGYGFPSYTLLGGSVIRLPFIPHTSLPHEIAHSWWGNGVDVDMGQGNWSEGLVSYLSDYLLKESRSPAEALEHRRQLLIDYASLVTPKNEFPLSGFVSRSDPASRAIGYGKGAMLFHMIRTQIGDEQFFGALRDVARERMYGSASWSDLIAAFSRKAGRDLAPWIETWLARPGGPRLSLSQVETRRERERWLVTGTVLQDPPRFVLDVPLRLETADGAVESVVTVEKDGATRFSLSAPSRPRRLLLDPEVHAFRILSQVEIPAMVNSLKGSTALVGVMTQNCRVQIGTFKAFMASLSQEGARVLDETRLGQVEGNPDLLFCGLPGDGSLLPPVPEGIELSSHAVSTGSAGPGDYLQLLVLKRPPPGKGVVALFQPLSEQAARQYGPKITHYGKYGHLVFYGGSIKQKQTPPVSDADAVVDLRAQP